jgi:glycine cleavage system H protein
MPDDRTFLMGKFPAVLPGALRYARNHMWCRLAEGLGQETRPQRWRFGFTSYAVRLMQDVYFLDWQVSPGDAVELLQQIGHIETSKAVSDLFAPLKGVIAAFNPALLDDPSGINVDNYDDGWLFDLDCDGDTLMTVGEYYQYLDEYWEKTQRLIKGKINTED